MYLPRRHSTIKTVSLSKGAYKASVHLYVILDWKFLRFSLVFIKRRHVAFNNISLGTENHLFRRWGVVPTRKDNIKTSIVIVPRKYLTRNPSNVMLSVDYYNVRDEYLDLTLTWPMLHSCCRLWGPLVSSFMMPSRTSSDYPVSDLAKYCME